MKIDFKQVLKNFDGTPIISGTITPETLSRALNMLDQEAQMRVFRALETERVRPLTLETVCCQAVGANLPDEIDARGAVIIPQDERMRRYKVGLRIVSPDEDGVVELSDEQRDMVKALLPRAWTGAIIPMQAQLMLESPSE